RTASLVCQSSVRPSCVAGAAVCAHAEMPCGESTSLQGTSSEVSVDSGFLIFGMTTSWADRAAASALPVIGDFWVGWSRAAASILDGAGGSAFCRSTPFLTRLFWVLFRRTISASSTPALLNVRFATDSPEIISLKRIKGAGGGAATG